MDIIFQIIVSFPLSYTAGDLGTPYISASLLILCSRLYNKHKYGMFSMEHFKFFIIV